jgi:hypothetical protein
MIKPKILIAVLTSSEQWINPWLVANLLQMHQDSRFEVEIQLVVDCRPVDTARNCCVIAAREHHADFLLMIDCDQSFWIKSPLDVLARAGSDKFIIGFPYAQTEPGKGSFWGAENREPNSEFFRVARMGTGAMFIHHTVWETIPGPWFKWCYDESTEARNVLIDSEGTALHEDYWFSKRALENNFVVWAHKDPISHWKTRDITWLQEQKPPIIPASAKTSEPKDVVWRWVTSKFCRVILLAKRRCQR